MRNPVVQGTPHLARKAQGRQITIRKGECVGTAKTEKHDSYGDRNHMGGGRRDYWKLEKKYASRKGKQ